MPGFGDFAQALQFGAGLVHGFQKQTEELKASHEQQQLELLKLLSHDKSKSIEPIPQEDIVGTEGFFGKGALKSKEGHPVFKVGGNAFAVKSRAPFQLPGTDEEETAAPAPVKGLEEEIPSTPTAPTAPSAPTAAPPSPAAPTLPQPQQPAAQKTKKLDWTAGYKNLTPDRRLEIDTAIHASAAKYKVPLHEAYSLFGTESNFNHATRSEKGAIGIGQLMQDTADELGVDPENLQENIDGSLKYYAQQKTRFGSTQLARAAYNAGPKAVEKAGNKIPPFKETMTYVQRGADAEGQFQRHFASQQQGNVQAATGKPADTSMLVAGGPGAPAPKPSAQPQEGEPDTSMQVAGVPGAPAPKPGKSVREDYGLGPELTIQDAKKKAALESDKTFVGSYEEPKAILAARRAAVKDAETRFFQEEREIAAAKKALKPDIHNLKLLDMLDHVHSAADFAHFLHTKDATTERDALAPAREQVAAAVATGDPEKRERAVINAYADLTNRNYTDAQIKETLQSAGVNDARELAKAKKLGQQQSEQQIATAKAEIPVKAEEAAATTTARMQAEEKAKPIVTNEAHREIIGQKLAEEINAGNVAKGTTVDAYARDNPDVITFARNTTQAEKDRENESTDPYKMEARVSFPGKRFNDLTGPELAAVREKVKQQKSDEKLGDAETIKRLDASIKSEAKMDEPFPAKDAQYFMHKDTLAPVPAEFSKGDFRAHAADYIRVTPSERKQIEAAIPVLSQVAEMRTLVPRVYGPGGTLHNMYKDTALMKRVGNNFDKLVSYAKENDPDMIQLDKLLAEYGAKSSRMFDGASGNVAFKFLEPTIKLQPRINVGSAFLPATRERLESDFRTAENQIKRNMRMLLGITSVDVSEPIPPGGGTAPKPVAAVAPTAAPATQAPPSPPRSKGEIEADDILGTEKK